MPPKNDIPIEEITPYLSYDPDTGLLKWKVRKGTKSEGSIAGFVEASGYVCIGLNGRTHKAHRLAWLLYYGSWPEVQLDHKDTDRTNNRIDNLRPADFFGNAQNQKRMKSNSSGFKGVSFHSQSEKWRASIRANGQHYSLGLHATPEAAASAYAVAANDLHQQFARTS